LIDSCCLLNSILTLKSVEAHLGGEVFLVVGGLVVVVEEEIFVVVLDVGVGVVVVVVVGFGVVEVEMGVIVVDPSL